MGEGYASTQVLGPNVDKEVLGVRSGWGAISKWAAVGAHGAARQSRRGTKGGTCQPEKQARMEWEGT
jgi:hypothetical protein